MKPFIRWLATTAGLTWLAQGALGAESLVEALRETEPLVNWRVRYEGVDQVGFSESADALTSRLRTGFRTGSVAGTTLLGEAVWTNGVGGDYNDTLNGETRYPVVADPGGFVAINRLAFTNKSLEHTALTLGRQRIILDDARFVGNVGWRQNEQTYDGLRAEIGFDGLKVDLSYLDQVNRIFGPDSPAGRWNGDVVLANVAKTFAWGTLTGFAYGIELDEAAALSTNTLGIRLSGSRPVGELSVIYTLSLAEQADAGANPANFSLPYYLAEGGIRIGKLTVALGFEQLGSDGINRVTTPLATLHAFQGWADKFLTTPAGGMDDSFLRVAYQPSTVAFFDSVNIVGVYHDFEANSGAMRYGDEFDMSIVARKGPVSLTLKYATYKADALLTDTDKFWFSMDYAF